ncbi:MAG: hypothetical protein JW987_05020 [Anaerolineaceae bacterium]|nr:hypothetical protein [Anaerolineaceae bacterium]
MKMIIISTCISLGMVSLISGCSSRMILEPSIPTVTDTSTTIPSSTATISPTETPNPTETPVQIPTATSIEELGEAIGLMVQPILANSGSEASVLQVSLQNDGSLLAIVVDDKAEVFDKIALSFAAAIFAFRDDPLLPDNFEILVVDNPSLLTGKARGLGIIKVSDIIDWGKDKIDDDELLTRIDFRTE